jgi:hypothetical protein
VAWDRRQLEKRLHLKASQPADTIHMLNCAFVSQVSWDVPLANGSEITLYQVQTQRVLQSDAATVALPKANKSASDTAPPQASRTSKWRVVYTNGSTHCELPLPRQVPNRFLGSRSYLVSNRERCTELRVRVKCCNAYGWSPWSRVLVMDKVSHSALFTQWGMKNRRPSTHLLYDMRSLNYLSFFGEQLSNQDSSASTNSDQDSFRSLLHAIPLPAAEYVFYTGMSDRHDEHSSFAQLAQTRYQCLSENDMDDKL